MPTSWRKTMPVAFCRLTSKSIFSTFAHHLKYAFHAFCNAIDRKNLRLVYNTSISSTIFTTNGSKKFPNSTFIDARQHNDFVANDVLKPVFW